MSKKESKSPPICTHSLLQITAEEEFVHTNYVRGYTDTHQEEIEIAGVVGHRRDSLPSP